MKRSAFALAFLLATTVASAQIYQWKDERGRTIISDKPPVGEVSQPRKIETGSVAGNAAPKKSSADLDLEFRKRLKESEKNAEAAKKTASEATAKQENCERAQRHLQLLESGERISMRDEKGERYFMDDAQRIAETTKTRQTVEANCGK